MRYERRKNKSKNKWKMILLVVLLCIASAVAYSYFEYKKGLNQSLNKIEKKDTPDKQDNTKEKELEFNGEKDELGGVNILLLGSDSRGEGGARADTIMVARYHPDKGTYQLLSFMRDMYVDIPGYKKNRINTAHALGGPELLRETLKQNFDIDIQYYAMVDFEGFVHLIDEAFPEGVEINVEKHMSHNIDVTIEPGLQKLDGEHMLGYVRFRHDAIGDFGRVNRQQEAIKQIGKQLASFQTIPKLPKLIGVVTPFIETNMSTVNILYVGKDFLSKEGREIESLRIPVDGAWADETINGAEVLSIDVVKNKEAIREFFMK